MRVTVQPPKSIQHCPVCRVAMLGSKSDEASAGFDSFTCLRCNTVMTVAPGSARKPDKP